LGFWGTGFWYAPQVNENLTLTNLPGLLGPLVVLLVWLQRNPLVIQGANDAEVFPISFGLSVQGRRWPTPGSVWMLDFVHHLLAIVGTAGKK
jgi:hypothetical protein